jgi:hypothetical protein
MSDVDMDDHNTDTNKHTMNNNGIMGHDDNVNANGLHAAVANHIIDDTIIRPLIDDIKQRTISSSESSKNKNGNDATTTSHGSAGHTEQEVPSRLSDIRLFTLPFWLLCGICICLYGTVVPWHSIASDLLQDRWYNKDPQRAGVMLGIPDTISAVSSPFFGLVSISTLYHFLCYTVLNSTN